MSEAVCNHPSLSPRLAELLTVKDIDLTVSEMNERILAYLAETVCRVKYPERSKAENKKFLSQLKHDASNTSQSVAVYVKLRELHEYLLTIPKLEKYK